MIHFIGIAVKISDVRLAALMIESAVRTAALQSGPEQKGELGFLSLFSCKNNLLMVGIHPLIRMAIHIQQRLKSTVISISGLSKIKKPHDPAPLFCRGQNQIFFQPEIPVPPRKEVIYSKFLSFVCNSFRRRPIIMLVLSQPSRNSCKGGDAPHPEIPPSAQFLHSSLKFLHSKKH